MLHLLQTEKQTNTQTKLNFIIDDQSHSIYINKVGNNKTVNNKKEGMYILIKKEGVIHCINIDLFGLIEVC